MTIITGFLLQKQLWKSHVENNNMGHLGGSVVEHLVMSSGHDPGVLGLIPASSSPQGACFSFHLYLCLSVSLMNK